MDPYSWRAMGPFRVFSARRAGERTLTLDAVQFEDVDVRDPDERPLTWSYDGRRIQ